MTNFTNGYKGITNWTISDIETLTENDAFAIAEGREEIKGHSVYFIDFDGYFGLSALVFINGRHVKYANDYQLHHPSIPRESLIDYYIEALNKKLYTEEEIAAPLKSYAEYSAKSYFLHNYYPMRVDYVSIFCINPTEEQQRDFEEKTKSMVYNPVAFAYMPDADFVRHHVALNEALEKAFEDTRNNYEYQKSAFLSEMFNHEYGINWQADFDTLSAFGNLEWMGDDAGADSYMKQLNFNDTQRKAYRDARKEYFSTAEF